MIKKNTIYVVTGGCSFTHLDEGSWPFKIESKYPIHVENLGSTGVGNGYIARSIIYYVSYLLNEGLSPSLIYVFPMWTSIDREEFLIDSKEYKKEIENPLTVSQYNWKPEVVGKSFWAKSNIRGRSSFSDKLDKMFGFYWENFWSEEQAFFKTMEYIYSLQSFLKVNKVNYTMLTWQNIFNDYNFSVPTGRYEGKRFPRFRLEPNTVLTPHELWTLGWMDTERWRNDRIWPKQLDMKLSKDSVKLYEKYPMIAYFWDHGLIDWDKWWFYEDTQVERGGLSEWAILGEKHAYGVSEEDPEHPNHNTHEEFAKKVVSPILTRMVKENFDEMEMTKLFHKLKRSQDLGFKTLKDTLSNQEKITKLIEDKFL